MPDPTNGDQSENEPDWGLQIKALCFENITAATIQEALELLETRNRLEFDRFQNLEVKGAALFAGIVAILAIVPKDSFEQLTSLLLFIPLFILGWMFGAKRYGFAPTPKSVLRGLAAAEELPKDDQQFSRAFVGSITTYTVSIDYNFKQNERKARKINAALWLLAGWAVVWILGHLVQAFSTHEGLMLNPSRAPVVQSVTSPDGKSEIEGPRQRALPYHPNIPNIRVSPPATAKRHYQ